MPLRQLLALDGMQEAPIGWLPVTSPGGTQIGVAEPKAASQR